MTTTTHLLRLEGVNLAHCINDTEDLSTRRGGSLMLLEACSRIEENDRFKGKLTAISTGASIGLFKVVANTDADVNTLADDVRHWLATDKHYRHATFVVDTVPLSDFPQAERHVVNANRWQQMQALSFSPAGLSGETQQRLNGPCAFDMVRPSRFEEKIGEGTFPISLSVHDRRRFGQDSKQSFYQRELPAATDLQSLSCVRRGFKTMTHRPDHPLDGKMAIFYADGNRFGRFARDAGTPDRLAAWDKAVKGMRRDFLRLLVTQAQSHGRWRTSTIIPDHAEEALGALRLETLLWGGDEFMFVVPAWCGFELARLFLKHGENLHYPGDATSPESRLTHACGLVFCSHKAPISHVAQLAKNLADQGKADSREENTLNWLVLESLDHVSNSLGDYLKLRFPGQTRVTWPSLAWQLDALDTLCRTLPGLKDELPRSAITQAARILAAGAVTHEQLTANYQQVTTAMAQADKLGWQALWAALCAISPEGETRTWTGTPADTDLPAWIKLLEAWDYVSDEGDDQ